LRRVDEIAIKRPRDAFSSTILIASEAGVRRAQARSERPIMISHRDHDPAGAIVENRTDSPTPSAMDPSRIRIAAYDPVFCTKNFVAGSVGYATESATGLSVANESTLRYWTSG
jgi:hypothetical protein